MLGLSAEGGHGHSGLLLIFKYYLFLYENGKMRPIETILTMWGGGGIKENDGEG
jgi:hypothetical protein